MRKKITRIEKQTKRDRYNIYLDGIYEFSISSRILADTGLQENKDLSEKDVEKIKETDIENKVYNRATLILSYRANTESELRKKLLKSFDEDVIDRIILKLKDQGFLNDFDFTKRYIESSKKGKKLVRLELLRKGIDKEQVEKALKTVSDEHELANASRAAKKVLKKYKNESQIKQKKKLYEALTRKGFSYNIYKQVIKNLYLGSG